MIEYRKIFAELTLAAGRAYNRGIQTGSGGNLSARVPGKNMMIVKSSGGSFIDCDEEGSGWIITDFDGTPLAGQKGKPTREVVLHGGLYKAVPRIGSIVHCHSPWSIVWSYSKKDLPMTTWHCQLKFGTPLPVIDVKSPMVPLEEMQAIVGLFRNNPDLPAFMLVGHGVVAVGKTAVDAEHTAEMVEETAMVTVLKSISEKLKIY